MLTSERITPYLPSTEHHSYRYPENGADMARKRVF
nr:MAG TPA: hypothetical protein [Caudoviricetes sp.]